MAMASSNEMATAVAADVPAMVPHRSESWSNPGTQRSKRPSQVANVAASAAGHPGLAAAALLLPIALCLVAGQVLGWRHDQSHKAMGAVVLFSLLPFGFLVWYRVRSQRRMNAGGREVDLEMAVLRAPKAQPPECFGPPVELGFADLVRERRIGGGKYGDVFFGRLVRSGDPVAVKAMKQGQHVTRRQINDLKEEIGIMRQIADHGGHRNIIAVRGYALGDDPVLVLELAQGSLHDRLLQMRDQREDMREPVAANFCLQIAQGMRYIEDCWVVHRDLAARNVLVAAGDVLKISDFGLARGVSHGFLKTGGYQANVNRKSNNWAWRWTAPEGLIEQKFTIRGDVWSFGIVITEICSRGDRPYHPQWSRADLEFIKFLDRGGRIAKGMTWPEDLYALARRCWKMEPKQRPAFKDIVNSLRKCGKLQRRWW